MEPIECRLLHDSMTPHMLLFLVNIAESPIYTFTDPWTLMALQERGLVKDKMAIVREWAYEGTHEPLTDKGHAFLRWYMSPRDMPTQLSLF